MGVREMTSSIHFPPSTNRYCLGQPMLYALLQLTAAACSPMRERWRQQDTVHFSLSCFKCQTTPLSRGSPSDSAHTACVTYCPFIIMVNFSCFLKGTFFFHAFSL